MIPVEHPELLGISPSELSHPIRSEDLDVCALDRPVRFNQLPTERGMNREAVVRQSPSRDAERRPVADHGTQNSAVIGLDEVRADARDGLFPVPFGADEALLQFNGAVLHWDSVDAIVPLPVVVHDRELIWRLPT